MNNNLELVYAFSKKLSKSHVKFEKTLDLFQKSTIYNKRFHKLKIFSDKETLPFIEKFNIPIEVIEFEDFLFLDDIKIKVLPELTYNQVLIDYDVFLFSKLILPTQCDVVLDRPDNINVWYIQELAESARQYKFFELLDFNPKDDISGNIGLMKFFDKELEKNYIYFYNQLKNIAKLEKEMLPPFPSYSILLGEIGLKNVIDKMGSILKFTSTMDVNNYEHLAGPKKSDPDRWLKSLNKDII